MLRFSRGKSTDDIKHLKKTRRRNGSSSTSNGETPSSNSLEPVMDGQDYTEHTKGRRLNFSRQPSVGSRGSMMPSPQVRPESIQIFGKQLFLWKKRGNRQGGNDPNPSASWLAVDEEIREGRPEAYYDDDSRRRTMTGTDQILIPDQPRARNFISNPFNFQHTTHVRHNHFANLQRTNPNEVLSESSAIPALQALLHGELKDIRGQDLHSDNFSSEALRVPQQSLKYSQLHDNLRSPPRVLQPAAAAYQKPSQSPGFQFSWDNAIDYAYEHGAEADCNYSWERCSFDDGVSTR
jgi:hypothetical protein